MSASDTSSKSSHSVVTIPPGLGDTKSSRITEVLKTRRQNAGAYDNADATRYYKPMPQYEGLHRWDPEFEWDEKEEKQLIRKVCSTTGQYYIFVVLNVILDRLTGVWLCMLNVLCPPT